LLNLGLKLTAAVAHLHAEGLVHRDIKPSNILFVGGEPKLADAGLVAAQDEARSLVGTAGYIAPEGPGSAQADLYALGKVLYEAAFGKDRQDFPQLPPDLRSRPDHAGLLEFNAILLKACATNPRERYQSAQEMRVDLEVLRAGRSVKRRQTWRRTQTLATKLLLAVSTLGLLTTLVYPLLPRSPRLSAIRKSRIVEANEEYKRGINELHLNLNAAEAIKHFKRAVELDPGFANAHAQLADAWFSIPGETNKSNGRVAAEKAVELDPQSGLARVFFAATKNYALDFSAAEREAKEAVRLSPDSEEVLLASALIFATIGLTNDALANLRKAIDVGQETPSKLRVIYSGFVYCWCRDFQSAITLYNETPWLKDGVDGPHGQQSLAYLGKGDYVSSMRLARQSALERGGDTNEVKAEFDSLEEAYKRGGQELYWQQKLIIETPRRSETHWMQMAAIHARLNHRAAAFAFLRQAKKEHPVYFGAAFYTDPGFDTLRGDPEFKDLEKQLWKQ
jgi:tetratricopeptide (TPR) repeat protein